MTAILRTSLLAAFVVASLPVVAAAQDRSTADLLRRIEVLERANADLEQRVRELEAVIKGAQSQRRPIAMSDRWKDRANWRQLRVGMNMDEVRALLGEPERVDGGNLTIWSWSSATVYFRSGKLERWSEPDR